MKGSGEAVGGQGKAVRRQMEAKERQGRTASENINPTNSPTFTCACDGPFVTEAVPPRVEPCSRESARSTATACCVARDADS